MAVSDECTDTGDNSPPSDGRGLSFSDWTFSVLNQLDTRDSIFTEIKQKQLNEIIIIIHDRMKYYVVYL